MAGRIRTIKPELLEDERTATLTHEAFRLFVGLLLLADDYGNFRANPKMLDGAVFHSQESREGLASLLDELAKVSLVTLYRVRDQAYGHLRGWDKHQKVDKPSKPRMPSPSDAEAVKIASLSDASRDPRAGLVQPSRDPRETLAPDLRPPTSDLDHEHLIPPVCADQGPATNAREEHPEHTHTAKVGRIDPESGDQMPPLPDAPWLRAQLARYPALARFAEDHDLAEDLAAGLQTRAYTLASAERVIDDFVTKTGLEARGMDRAAVQRGLGGFIANGKTRATVRSGGADPQSAEVRTALRVFDELWSAANGGRPRASDDGDPEAAAGCVALAKAAASKADGALTGKDVYLQAVEAYLADSNPRLADDQWPLRLLQKRWSSYVKLPKARALSGPGPARAEPEPLLSTTKRRPIAAAPSGAVGDLATILPLVLGGRS